MIRLRDTLGWGIVALAALACAALSPALHAQTPPQAPQKPAVDDSPRFEIKRFVFEGATLVPRSDLEARTQQFTGPRRNFADVQRALETVERAYSDAGWSAVQIILPEQELERGEIRFQVIEAKVGRVLVEGNKFFDDANIRASVPALAPGKSPNINEIARNIRIANENPSKQATVLLRSGQEEATVDAVLRVVDEKPMKLSVTVDNTGTPATGVLRVGYGMQHGNITGRDDVLTTQVVTSPYANHVTEDNEINRLSLWPSRKVTILGLGYKLPLYSLGDSIDFTFGYSNVNTGTVANLFAITGQGSIYGARYTHNLDKIGDYEHRIAFSQDYRTYDNKGVRAAGTTIQVIPDVEVHPFGVTYLGVYRQQNSETGFSLAWYRNLAGKGDGDHDAFCRSRTNVVIGKCAKANYELWRWSFNHNHALPGDWQARFAMNGQITHDMLITGEQFGIGGADSVRGFLEREVSADQGERGTFELYSPDLGNLTQIAGARMRVLAFYDWGNVKRLHPGPAEQWGQGIASRGLGLRFSKGTSFAFRADWGTVADGGGNPAAPKVRGTSKVHFSMSLVF